MKVAVFSSKPYDQRFLTDANRQYGHDLVFFEAALTSCEPGMRCQRCRLTEGFDAACVFVNDQLDRDVLDVMHQNGTDMIALRCAGFNNVDLEHAARLGMTVARVPAYSPHAVAEHAIGLMLAVCRKLHKAYNRTREGNFSLEGLLGFDLYGKAAGVIGTGKIGQVVARLLQAFGCRVLAYDVNIDPGLVEEGVEYVELDRLFTESDIVTLHCPLVAQTHHVIKAESLKRMRDGVVLVNTSRGALIDTESVIDALKSGKIGALAIDVYEEEADLFFEDYSDRVILDDVLARLFTFPNVIVTGHQAFFTQTAMTEIVRQTLENLTAYEQGIDPPGMITLQR